MTDGGRTHVIPNSINYSDVKPEQIENTVKLIRFTPTANVQSAGPNDVIKFMLQGNGFLDPFSTYIDIEVNIMPEWDSGAYAASPAIGFVRPHVLAPAAHAPSQVALAQACTGPNFDRSGFAGMDAYETVVHVGKYLDRSAHSFIHRFVARSQGEEIERIEEYDVLAAMINDMLYSREQKKIHANEGFPHSSMIGGKGVVALGGDGDTYMPVCGRGDQGCSIYAQYLEAVFADEKGTYDPLISMTLPATYDGKLVMNIQSQSGLSDYSIATGSDMEGLQNIGDIIEAAPGNLYNPDGDNRIQDLNFFKRKNSHLKRFTIPIYSGIIGVLIPEKKLIPLNLMPLELEFSMNPHALYCLQPTGPQDPHVNTPLTRNYVITKFEIYGNVIMFEQQVHRALDQVVAQQGLYIPFNTFYLAPQSVNNGAAGTGITAFSQINVYFKSINSVHTVFIYSGYRNYTYQRKLHFVSHRLTQLQLRNGTEYTPSERIIGDMGNSAKVGGGNAFYIETLKAYNKLHDPTTDAAFEGCNYYIDSLHTAQFRGPKRLSSLHTQQALLGRCQYGISLEGEEMGKDKTTLSGRRGMQPFDLMQVGTKTMAQGSNQLIFVRADMVVFIRQDLVVQLLGR